MENLHHLHHLWVDEMKAEAGDCPCGRKVWRADLPDGTVATVETQPVGPAAELAEWAARRPTYRLSWTKTGMNLTPRADRDIRLRPVGYRAGDRVVVQHRCPDLAQAAEQEATA